MESQQEKLERLQAEVEALREQLNAARRLATVGTMTAMVSHELNNILTPIINYAQLARSNPALVDKAIDRAAEGGQRASSICKAILGISSTQQNQEMTEQNLSELLAQALEAMARDPRKDSITLNINVPGDLTLRTNRAELQQVLLNLIINARSAVLSSSGPRTIDVAASRRDGWVNITVRDNGVGIAPEHLDRIFKPFFTTKNGDGNSGYGLGLAFCHHAVTSMGGEILVESKVGTGTTFTVRLPG